MRSDIFRSENLATAPTAVGMSLQNPKCVKYALYGEVLARQGVMVAYRGQVSFEVKSQGVGRLVARMVTGEGLPLMAASGHGEVWFADGAADCFIIDLEGGADRFTVNGRSVLCFDPTLSYNISRVEGAGMLGGGLFNCVFQGAGRLAIVSDGPPIVIPVEPNSPVFVDTDAVIGWSASLQAGIVKSQSFKSMLKGGSGEVFQLALNGSGHVLVQPSEGPPKGLPGRG